MDPFKWRRGAGVRRFGERARLQLRREYESGLTLNALARRYNSERETVRRAIVDAGGTIRKKGTKGVPS